jgi:hypothetical protein
MRVVVRLLKLPQFTWVIWAAGFVDLQPAIAILDSCAN